MDRFHIDYASLQPLHAEISRLSGGAQALASAFPVIVSDAVDFVVDPVRTARTKVSDLDNVEKTFIGLKVEHYLRDFLNVPKGLRDLRIAGMDVDVKNTVSKTWMIPPETFKNVEPCILIMVATEDRHCSMGLMIARPEYLNAPNRDAKRSVSSKAFENIYWMVKQQPLPESRFNGIDMARFRELRTVRGGVKRAAAFFRENIGKVIHRTVVQGLLFDQDDYMKRIRANGGAKDILSRENIAILSGAYAQMAINAFGLASCQKDEFISWRYSEADKEILDLVGYFSGKSQK